MHVFVEHLVTLSTRIGSWGYLIIFLIVLLECQAFLGLFIPGESMLLDHLTDGVADVKAKPVGIRVEYVSWFHSWTRNLVLPDDSHMVNGPTTLLGAVPRRHPDWSATLVDLLEKYRKKRQGARVLKKNKANNLFELLAL